MSGETIKTILEDVADNLFNPDPYYQQGGDMVRVGWHAATRVAPGAAMGERIGDMRVRGKPIEAGKRYKVAGWAPVAGRGAGRGRRTGLGAGRALAERAENRSRRASSICHDSSVSRGNPGIAM